jgi:hypothetical protein
LTTLVIRPNHTTVSVGDQVAFTCSGKDQYEQDLKPLAIEWTAKGGSVASDGIFTAGANPGQFTVHVQSGGVEAIAEIRIVEKANEAVTGSATGSEPAPAKGTRVLRWEGRVPPQKWMNFYTKVLTKFSASPDLRLTVSFEIPLDSEEAENRQADSRSGLQELGLDANVRID